MDPNLFEIVAKTALHMRKCCGIERLVARVQCLLHNERGYGPPGVARLDAVYL